MDSEWLNGLYIVPTEEVRTCGDMGWNRNAHNSTEFMMELEIRNR